MKLGKRILLIVLIAFATIQLYPYGRDHANPPVIAEPPWHDQATRELFFRACADCHSNETKWPWYSHVAPISWLVQKDVNEGREHFNVSEWGRDNKHAHEAAKEVRQGKMPLPIYLPTHPEARLSDADKQTLIEGLVATFGDDHD